MRYILIVFASVLLLGACRSDYRRVDGNGVVETKEKVLKPFDELEVSGAFDVTVVPSSNFKAVIETDENLQGLIKIDQEGDRLKIRTRNNVSFKSTKGIKITVYTNTLRRIEMAGSGKVMSRGLLENTNRMEITIAGSGDADLEVKTPEIKVSIGGSGKVILNGKTRKLELNIAGSGDFEGERLLSESADVSIAGSGNAKLFASVNLEVSIAGSGDVYYAGNPTNVKKSIAGVGNVKPISDSE